MKSKVIFALFTVVFCMGLAMACSDADDGNNVTISFKTACLANCLCGGSDKAASVKSIQIPKGSSVDLSKKKLPIPSKPNHNFSGWNYSDGGSFFTDDILSENITLNARWTWQDPNRGNIIFDPKNGANTLSRSGQNVGSPISDFPANPVLFGFIFEGWFDDNGKKFDSTTLLDRVRITLTAKWAEDTSIERVTVSFTGVSEEIPNVQVPKGGTLGVNFPPNPASGDPENQFLGWFDAIGVKFDKDSVITGSVTLTAKFIKYGVQPDGSYLIDHSKWSGIANGDTLRFESQYQARQFNLSNIGGLDILNNYSQLVVFYSLIPANPAQTSGFSLTFGSDKPSPTSEYGDIAYINLSGPGSAVLIVPSANLNTFKNIESTSQIVFKQNSSNSFSMKISAMMLVGDTPPTVTVKFDAGGYGQDKEVKLTAGNAIGANNMPAAPVRDGYFFDRWYDPATGVTVNSNTRPANITVIPDWIKILNVTFKSEGAEIHKLRVTQGFSFSNNKLSDKFPADPSHSTKDDPDQDFSFMGWFAEADTGYLKRFINTTVIEDDVVLIARWQDAKDIAKITFDTAGGTAIAGFDWVKGTPLGTFLSIPVKNPSQGIGYYFEGWFDVSDPENQIEYTDETVITGSVTLTAKWEARLPLEIKLDEGKESDTLFSAVGNWNAEQGQHNEKTPFEYDGKKWWVLGANHTGDFWAAKNASCPQTLYDSVKQWHGTGYTRLAFTFPNEPNVYEAYTQLSVYYEILPVAGTTTSIQIRRSLEAAGGAGIADSFTPAQSLSANAGSTFTRQMAAFTTDTGAEIGGIGIVNSSTSTAMLFRVTQVRFHH